MDYKTKPITRNEIRQLAKVFDVLMGTTGILYKPVVEYLDKIIDIMSNAHYEIVEDDAFEEAVPARGYFREDGSYTIEIKQWVYDAAIGGNGACRGFIMHEIFHPFMYKMGYVPLLERSFANGELKPYESVEWQVKAITGEFMMEYEATKNMTAEEIIKKCGVSYGFAKARLNYEGGGNYACIK